MSRREKKTRIRFRPTVKAGRMTERCSYFVIRSRGRMISLHSTTRGNGVQ
jgi:hypothetical protein